MAILLSGAALLGGCAVAGGITPQEQAIQQQVDVDQYMPATRAMRDNIETQELFAQAAFWGNEYQLNPTDLEATIKLSAAVRKMGNPGRAVEITQTSRQLHPRDPYLLAEHAAGLIAGERALDAVPVLDQGLRIAPNYGRLWSLKGAALDQMEDYETARKHYARALQITPHDPNVLANLGLSHALSGDPQTAEVWLRRAASLPGASAGVRQNLALVLQLQGKEDAAAQQARLSQLSQGDRQLPPEPVPAFTPRGVPARMAETTSYSDPVPVTSYDPRQQASLNGRQAQATRGRVGQQQSRMAAPQHSASPQTAPLMRGSFPQSRLTTMTSDGQPFTNSREAARGQVDYATHGQISTTPTASRAPAPLPTMNEMTAEQKSVLSSIRQSLQPGAVGPQPQQMADKPYLVGPSPTATPQREPTPYGQQDYNAAVQQTYRGQQNVQSASQDRRTPARRRR